MRRATIRRDILAVICVSHLETCLATPPDAATAGGRLPPAIHDQRLQKAATAVIRAHKIKTIMNEQDQAPPSGEAQASEPAVNEPAADEGEGLVSAESGFVRKFGVAVVGIVVILIGIPLIPLVGPGWLIVFTGLAILASEFEWADRLRTKIRERLRALFSNQPAGNDE